MSQYWPPSTGWRSSPGSSSPTAPCGSNLHAPTDEKRRQVEKQLFVELPSREDMLEIEPSSRLYVDGDAAYMTATVITHADAPKPSSDVITFILTRKALVTLRYVDPRPVRSFAMRLVKQPTACATPEVAFLGLVETFIDRIADILEKVALDLDQLSQKIFHEDPQRIGPGQLDLRGRLMNKTVRSIASLARN